MKKIFMFLIFILSSCTIVDSIREIGVDNKDCIGVRRFKILQVIEDAALAHECFTSDCSDAYKNTLDLIIKDKVDYYDDMIYEVPADKCAIRNGVFKYENKEGSIKTVSVIYFGYMNNPKTEEERQQRILESKKIILKSKIRLVEICLNDFEGKETQKDIEFCECYADVYIDSNGDKNEVKKTCGKLPKFYH